MSGPGEELTPKHGCIQYSIVCGWQPLCVCQQRYQLACNSLQFAQCTVVPMRSPKMVKMDAVFKALQQREESVRNGKLTTIVFIRDKNAKGQEVSGYIDYGHR